ncbi:MAG: hypothetical protein H0U85_07505, partial [Gemmatimonadales bacterium]|nr:hypothetical protein [Gemmatimonadales bacterium]
MRKYWLKVALGAFAIFAVGMIVKSLIDKGRSSVHDMVDGSGPISIPLLGIMPFNLDGTRLGSIHRVTVFRSDPKTPSRLDVVVQLPDSIASARLASCILTADDLQKFNSRTSFRCATASDTANKSLVPFGAILVRGRPDSFPLLLTPETVRDFTERHASSSPRGRRDRTTPADARADSLRELADSISQAADARADSITLAVDQQTDRAGATARHLA